MFPSRLTRRTFLSRSAAAAAGVFLSSCFGERLSTSPTPRPLYGPSPADVDTRWPVKRVIYLMLENRSFDHLFGRFPGARGARSGIRDGEEVPLVRCPEWLPDDILHSTGAWRACFNDGAMDGFAREGAGEHFAYSQFAPRDLPNYFTWAKEFVLGDNFFASVAGPSYPNHLYFVAGQAARAIDNPENIRARWDGNKVFKSWGCDAYGDDVHVLVRNDDGSIGRSEPCFDFGSVGEQLSRRNIDWASYSADPYQAGYIWQAYTSIRDVFHNEEVWDEHIWPVDDLLRDIEADALPSVTWITPRYQLSDHPPFSTKHAHNWVTEVTNAVMRSGMWEHVAMFITWDEWGGFYDHVPPPTIDEVPLGFRAPLLVISPYAKRGYVDDAFGEFSSPLRFIADNWGLPYLTSRIRRSHNFSHVFDFDRRPRSAHPLPPVEASGSFWDWPEQYPGWPAGVEPEDPRVRYP